MSENKNARLPADNGKPVAWISDSPTKGNGKQLHWTKAEAWRWSSNITPLYTAPPQRKPLTDEQIIKHFQEHVDTGSLLSFADGVRFAEAAHGINP